MNIELLLKYIGGKVTDQERETITTWLDQSPENMKEYLRLRKIQDITIWHEPTFTNAAQPPIKKTKVFSLKRTILEALKIAAVMLLAFVGFRYVYPVKQVLSPIVMQTLHVPAGQRAELTLTDGTKVWLNAKTTLTFPNQFSGQFREVKMDGEGYFNVTSNKSKPFIVKTEQYDVRVLGTQFNLMAYSGKGIFETSLIEGAVEVMKPGSEKGISIKPDERIYLNNNQLITAPITHRNHFLWKDGIISFDNESFPDMVRKLELYFDLAINVKNDRFRDYRCTGKFRTKDGVEHILKVLQINNNFRFKIDDKLNIITIE